MKAPESVAIHWFRRDLRLEDNAALYHALKSNLPVIPIFIFDAEILDKLENKSDRRVEFIHSALEEINDKLKSLGSCLQVFYGKPAEVWQTILKQWPVKEVYANHDYEPSAIKRDNSIYELLQRNGSLFKTFKDQCIFEKGEVVKDDGKPYTVFTPYSRKWLAKVNVFYVKSYPVEKYFSRFAKLEFKRVIPLKEIGFTAVGQKFPSKEIQKDIVRNYAQTRDIPAVEGTSRLSVHLRFGTVSIRELVRVGQALDATWLKELIWRDFYMMILYHFPQVVKHAFKPDYDRIHWRNNEEEFLAWCDGKTGYPIVDAGMRELNTTGFMHNRVRMIVASFLVKHLLIDWRWGEAYFAEKLLDFDLSANNGGWQWAAGSGCDAAPYFRVFNPTLQAQKFDPELKYIKKWVPELNDINYQPVVNHEFARKRVLEVYKKALSE